MSKLIEIIGLSLLALTSVLLLINVSKGQPVPNPDWFCTSISDTAPIACFEPKKVQLLIPSLNYVDLASGSYVQMTNEDWDRFIAQYNLPNIPRTSSYFTVKPNVERNKR